MPRRWVEHVKLADQRVIILPFDSKQLVRNVIDGEGQVPLQVTRINKFFHGAKPPRKNQKGINFRVRISHDSPLEDFMPDTKAFLDDIDGGLYETLQCAEVNKHSFLKNSHPNMDIGAVTDRLNRIILRLSSEEGSPKNPDFRLQKKNLWTGVKAKRDDDDWRTKQAMHVTFKKGHEREGSRLIAKAL